MGLILNRGGSRGRSKRALSFWGLSPTDMVGLRTAARVGRKVISSKESLEQSAVWAAVRLRADLISTLPIETYQMVDNMRVDSGATPFIGSPEFMEFLYSSQSDLDMHGNAIGVIDSFISNTKIPAHITLKEATSCQVIVKDDIITNYRIDGIEYNPSVIWHEKQFTMAGLHVGLSPVEYAAYTLGQYASVRDFASQWFESGNGPRASLKNTEKKIDSREATIAKESWKATQEMGEPFVHGSNWEYSLIEAQSASNDWITAQQFGLTEAARYFGVPSNLIDAAMSGDHVTYANVVQRNLQFLIMHLGPAIRRRENSLSGLLPKPRNLKFDEDALLRMDPVTRAQMIETKINSRVLAPSEARKADNLPPFTLEQIEEFDALGLNRRNATPQTSLSPMQPEFAGVYAGDIPPTGADEDPIPNAPLPVQPGAKVPPSPTKGNGK